jgi:zinc transport system ATP-binding protein
MPSCDTRVHGGQVNVARHQAACDRAVLRHTLEHCSLFGLTTGLRVLEIGDTNGSGLRDVLTGVLNDVEYQLVAVAAAAATLAQEERAFDVIVLNHLSPVERDEVRAAPKLPLRPNGILVMSGFPTVDGIVIDRPVSAARPPNFASGDYTFELRKPFGGSLNAERSFGIYNGKWNLIVGRSGSGKTSFLRALQGDLPAYTPAAVGFPRRRYFYMPQNVDVFDMLSPVENVRTYGGTSEQAMGYFEELGVVQPFKNRKHSLGISGGERQRLLVAQILAAEPKLLILDEPSKGLDRAGRLMMFNALAKHFERAQGTSPTVVCADHDFAAVYRQFDYVFEIANGQQTLVWQKEALS